ncbi:two-component regulator propeller domain-containing protein [Mucilaginibacter sp. KACC 22773]|uniref:sensor histidine kinase n=1 Tax=Mucilaginibacter sp. KACC 22773 TaxID=3025671 RepID=UPI002365A527|nr:two-component regulator propeller domain-containing protein [Mucilaginibacter sp. KACC 22773]WDF75575.1 two-component regulator propeller domain-containing protein [Mucilaginibacter sp. KACC 22773]
MFLRSHTLKLLLLLQFLITGVYASTPYQVVYLKNYRASDGLPGSQVNYLMQDSKGFIWIATDKGVSRFDGQHFKNFTTTDGLESNEVFRVAEDNYHRIFFYCNNYRVCYYENGLIHKLASTQKIFVSPFANLFFNRFNELCVNYELNTKVYRFEELKSRKHQEQRPGSYIYGASGEEAVLSENDLSILKNELGAAHLNYITANTNTKPYRLALQQNHLLLISKDWVHVYQYQKNGIIPLNQINFTGNVTSVYLTGKNTFAVTTVKQGTYIINYITGERKNYLNNQITTSTLIDRENNLWFGTYESGIFLSTNPEVKVINKESGLVNENVLKLGIAGGYLFAGHILTGLSYMKLNPNQNTSIGTLYLKQNRSDFNRVTSLLPITGNRLVIGTDNGIFRLDLLNTNPPFWRPVSYINGPVKGIIERPDTVYFLTQSTLCVVSNQFKHIIGYPFDLIRTTSITCHKGHILIGSLYGLYQMVPPINASHFKYVRILADKGINAVKCLASNGQVCAIGTEDKGVYLLTGKAISQFTSPAISSGNIRKLIWTDANTLWACTANGVSIINFNNNYQTYRVGRLNTSNGLPSDNVADVVRHGNDYYIATDQGIAVTQNLWNTNLPRPILLDDGVPGKQRSFTYGKPIVFNCVALSYKSMGKMQYRFRLKDVDKNWSVAPTGEKRFDLLPPGHYELEAVAADRFNQLSRPLVFQFTVMPLWYQQLWLQVIAVTGAIFISFLLIRKYYLSIIGLQKKDYENALALQRERQRISSEVHDDLGASISGIKLQTEMLSRKVTNQPVFKEIDAIHEAITDISTQVRLIIWSLDVENDEVSSLANFIHKQAIKLFDSSDISLQESISVGETTIAISGEKRRQVYLLVKEVLNNIIKHSDAQNAFLAISLYKNRLHINIRDDGRGFVPDVRKHETMGIRNIYARAKRLNADLKIDTAPGKGASISLKLNL